MFFNRESKWPEADSVIVKWAQSPLFFALSLTHSLSLFVKCDICRHFFCSFPFAKLSSLKRSKNLVLFCCELIDMRFYPSDYFNSVSLFLCPQVGASVCLHSYIAILSFCCTIQFVMFFLLFFSCLVVISFFPDHWSHDKFKLISYLFYFFMMPPNNWNVFKT